MDRFLQARASTDEEDLFLNLTIGFVMFRRIKDFIAFRIFLKIGLKSSFIRTAFYAHQVIVHDQIIHILKARSETNVMMTNTVSWGETVKRYFDLFPKTSDAHNSLRNEKSEILKT